jgi:AcrR family transcriptional regulator
VPAHLRTREAVLEAALAAFAQYTYNGTPMTAVAERAGVAVGTIYRHFPSKDALGNAVFRRWKGRLLERLLADAPPDESVRATFARFWRTLLAFAGEHPTAFAFLEYQQHEGYLDAQSQAVSDRLITAAVDWIVRGQRTGEIRPDEPELLLALVYGALVGVTKAARSGGAIGPEQLAAAEHAVWELLRARPVPPP